jgi:hypothetical protein
MEIRSILYIVVFLIILSVLIYYMGVYKDNFVSFILYILLLIIILIGIIYFSVNWSNL